MASYKVCVVIALACAIAACSAEEGKRAERFAFGGLGGFGLAGAALPVATSYSLPVAKTILPIAPAVTSYAAPAIAAPIVSHAVAPVVSTYAAAAPVVSTYAAAPVVSSYAAPVVSSYAAPVVAHAPVVSSFGYSGVAAGYSAGFGYGAYGHGLLKK